MKKGLCFLVGASLFMAMIIVDEALGEDYEQDTLYDDEEQNKRDARIAGNLFSFLGEDDYGGRSYRFRRQEDDQDQVKHFSCFVICKCRNVSVTCSLVYEGG